MKSSLFAISIPVAISILSKYRGSRSVDETMFNIIAKDEDLRKAEVAHRARIQNIPKETKPPKIPKNASRKTIEGFKMLNWRAKNPGIKYFSDLLFVEKLDEIGQDLLNKWLSLSIEPEAFQSLDNTQDNVWENKIIDPYTHWNMEITRTTDLPKRATNKKATPSLKDVAHAPIGKIPFYERYDVPYRIKPKKIIPSQIWK